MEPGGPPLKDGSVVGGINVAGGGGLFEGPVATEARRGFGTRVTEPGADRRGECRLEVVADRGFIISIVVQASGADGGFKGA